jgi:SAM-dependent methyltransferase
MTLSESAEKMRLNWVGRKYPRLVYVETTNACNARCTYCLYDRMERPVEYMSFDNFKRIANKVKEEGLQIGAMFCFGEPLLDENLFDKIRYGRKLDVFPSYMGLNTNCSVLTQNRYDDILSTVNNITLSFVNVGEEFEKLTKLKWSKCYVNALKFIEYRDKHKPEFNIQIGCNDVTGHNRKKVENAFKGYKINWARDAEIQWGSKVITGVIDRSIMYNTWSCDGHKGAMQIKPNGDCCFCAYDVIRSETRFANIFVDSWVNIERNFKVAWERPNPLCLRCDFWWNYFQMVAGKWKRGKHIDSSWQDAYLKGLQDYWEENHNNKNKRFLTGSRPQAVWKYLGVDPKKGDSILNIGLGLGYETVEAFNLGLNVYGLDISEKAIENVSKYLVQGWTNSESLPSCEFDYAVSNLVAQHMNQPDLIDQLRNVIRSLKKDGVLAIQYASPIKREIYREDLEAQRLGIVRRTPEHFKHIVWMAGGEIVKSSQTRFFDPDKRTDDACWNGCLIIKHREIKPIGVHCDT